MIEGLQDKAVLEFSAKAIHVGPVLGFLDAFSSQLGVEEARRTLLHEATSQALALVVKNNESLLPSPSVSVEISETNGELLVEVLNRGVPINVNHNGQGALFHQLTQQLDRVVLENQGRQGQAIVLGMKLGGGAARKSLERSVHPNEAFDPQTTAIEIRRLCKADAARVSELFFYVYGYDYIHEFVYYPEKLEKMIDSQELVSVAAVLPNGRLVGHVALRRWGDSPAAYEPCLGVVDSALKSQGVFSRVFQEAMDLVENIPMNFLFFDFVTNHEFSQKFVARYHPVDLAIFVGCQSKATQAKLERLGMGADPKESDRYSLLYSVLPRVEFPFGHEVELPMSLGEDLGFLLEPLGISWYPASRFSILPDGGFYKSSREPAQNAIYFDLVTPGRDAVEKILLEWQTCLRNGYEYAAVDVLVGALGIGNLYDMLQEAGFFVAGFLPHNMSNQLSLRFQAIGPTKVAFDEIKVYSAISNRLLDLIQIQFERNQHL